MGARSTSRRAHAKYCAGARRGRAIAQRRGDLLRSLQQPDELGPRAAAVQTPAGAVDEFDCLVGRGPEAREAALEAAWASVEAGRPTLFRGVGAHWPAVQEWTVETLRAELARGVVRVAPSSAVTFCRESHPDVQSGVIAPPSRSFVMSTEEFDDRLRAGRRGRAPLLYDEDERVYLQALAPHAMMRQVDLSFILPTAAAERGVAAVGVGAGHALASPLRRAGLLPVPGAGREATAALVR